jgi:hypothetical protein
MPQLDIDLFDDFLFFAFVSLLLGIGDEEGEEGVVEMATDRHLAHFYIGLKKHLAEQRRVVKDLFAPSILR